jgi:hypothetical protein
LSGSTDGGSGSGDLLPSSSGPDSVTDSSGSGTDLSSGH